MNLKSKCTVYLMIGIMLIGALRMKYGHHYYKQIDKERLVEVGKYPDGRKKYLAQEAYSTFKKMRKDALKDGIKLTILSAFRSVRYQKKLFKRAVKKYGSKKEAARHVAPPGYSEHHTGCALDIGDKNRPKTHLSTRFAKTPAFKWLKKNAKIYEFTLSFPKNNPSDVSYEPWHWRYIKPTKNK